MWSGRCRFVSCAPLVLIDNGHTEGYDRRIMATIQDITTARELLEASDLGRCELLRGELVMMSPSGAEHGAIAVRIAASLQSFVRERRMGTVIGADGGFQIAHDPDTVRAPDVGFVCADRVRGGLPRGFFPGAPDLAVEVVSPSEIAGRFARWAFPTNSPAATWFRVFGSRWPRYSFRNRSLWPWRPYSTLRPPKSCSTPAILDLASWSAENW